MTFEEAKTFVSVWQSSSNLKEVTEKTGKKKEDVLSTARAMRRKGVNLKAFNGGTRKMTSEEWSDLAKMVA